MFDMNLIEKSQVIAEVIRPHHLGSFMIHPRVVEKYQSAAKWPSVGRTLASPERCQACTSKKQQRNEGWADILNDLLSIIGRHVSLLLPSTAPAWPFINSVSWDNQVHLFLGVRWTGFPSENSSPPQGCLYLPSILAGLYYSLSACLHSWCQVLTDASSFPLSNASHFSVFFFFPFFFSFSLCVCIIIICPERALSEGGLFVLQPGSQLFSGSAVFFSSPSVQFEYPREIWLCLWYLFFVLLSFYFSSSVCSLPRYCHLFWRLIVSHVFFFLFCLAVQKISVDIIVLVKKKKKNQDSFFFI